MITLEEVNNLKPEYIKELYLKYSNSGLYKVFNILGLAGLEPVSAEGIYIYCKNDKKIYDFTAGNCVLNLGHNHPRILKARNLFNSKKYRAPALSELNAYLFGPIFTISVIPIDGVKDFNGSINPCSLCDLYNGYLVYLILFFSFLPP